MKWYNGENYNRYRNEVKGLNNHAIDLNNHESIINRFIYLPEKIAREFSMSETACGRLNIEDLIQEGMIGLCIASKMVDESLVKNTDNHDRFIASYLSHRIRGQIRRAIDGFRGTIRIPERKIREIRNDKEEVDTYRDSFFFNVLKQIDDDLIRNGRMVVDSNNELKEYNYNIVVAYLLGVFNANLNKTESIVLKKWYGLQTPKESLNQIAIDLGGDYTTQKVFELKNKALNKINGKINKGEIVDFLFT